MLAGPSDLLTVADIRIAPGVDTTHAATWTCLPQAGAINCLRRFLTRKMDPEAPKDYWYAPDMEDYGGPYAELLCAEFDSVGDLRYRPTVLEARSAGDGEILLKVMWSDVPGTPDPSTRSPIISPRHLFNPAEAQEQRILIERLSAFFGVPATYRFRSSLAQFAGFSAM